jgi:hypothetical protein
MSTNPRLTSDQIKELFDPLFLQTNARLEELSAGDPQLLFALRRKLFKELGYLERGSPHTRNKLKAMKRIEQGGLCAICQQALPKSHTELDRMEAIVGYTPENTRLVHHGCHVEDQRKKGYS